MPALGGGGGLWEEEACLQQQNAIWFSQDGFFKMVFQDVCSRQVGGRRGSREVHALGSGGGVGEEEAFLQQQKATWFFQDGFSKWFFKMCVVARTDDEEAAWRFLP